MFVQYNSRREEFFSRFYISEVAWSKCIVSKSWLTCNNVLQHNKTIRYYNFLITRRRAFHETLRTNSKGLNKVSVTRLTTRTLQKSFPVIGNRFGYGTGDVSEKSFSNGLSLVRRACNRCCR